jgi:predicted lipoprotein with Yx(FWY)xxD motif
MISVKRLSVVILSLLCLMGLAACANTPPGSPNSAVTYGYQAKATTAPKPTVTPLAQKQAQVTKPKTPTTTMQGNQQHGTMAGASNHNAMPSTDNKQNSTQNTSTSGGTSQGTYTSNGTSQGSGKQNSTGSTYIKVSQTSINGQTVQILTTGTGLTLYYRTSDVPPNAVCTGACAQAWPPLLAQGQIITSMTITSGQLTIQQTANGKQVEYNGHPLYTYVGDTAAGQTKGQGVGNVWFTVSVTTQAYHW